MDRRTKILAIGFGAVVAYVLLAQAVYPRWIKPLMTIDERIAEREKELHELEKLQKAVDEAKIQYRDFVARIGSFDPGRVETEVRDLLNRLIEKHKLQNTSVSPSRPVEDRKTGLTTSVITVNAVGSLEAAVSFLKEVSQLPQLARVMTPAIYPASSGPRKGAEKDLVNVRLPIELLVLPQNKTVGRIDAEKLPKTETFVRHDATRDYSEIWKRTPFTPYVELPPLRVDLQKSLQFEVGTPAFLQANASGGEGNYTYSWDPAEGLGDPTQARTSVDTSTIGNKTYTITVTDTGRDVKPVSASVAVNIREKPPAPFKDDTPPPPPPPQTPVVQRDRDGQSKHIVMTLLRSAGTARTNEVMVDNARTKETNYYKVGDDFDGGKLVYVHHTGAVVRTMSQYHVYPLGTGFNERMEYTAASDYPELKAAAERAIAREAARAQAAPPPSPMERDGNVGQAGSQPALDSRGAPTAPAAASPEAPGATQEGPVVAEEAAQPQEAAGPPAQPEQDPSARPVADRKIKPDPKSSIPNPAPPRGGNTRPRPKKGRL